MSSTRITRHIKAPRAKVYDALIDADAIARWKVPTGMTPHVHAFEGRKGGTFRISLTYDAPTGTGKTSARTDTYHGRFDCRNGPAALTGESFAPGTFLSQEETLCSARYAGEAVWL